jgi:hypothetical protein
MRAIKVARNSGLLDCSSALQMIAQCYIWPCTRIAIRTVGQRFQFKYTFAVMLGSSSQSTMPTTVPLFASQTQAVTELEEKSRPAAFQIAALFSYMLIRRSLRRTDCVVKGVQGARRERVEHAGTAFFSAQCRARPKMARSAV